MGYEVVLDFLGRAIPTSILGFVMVLIFYRPLRRKLLGEGSVSESSAVVNEATAGRIMTESQVLRSTEDRALVAMYFDRLQKVEASDEAMRRREDVLDAFIDVLATEIRRLGGNVPPRPTLPKIP